MGFTEVLTILFIVLKATGYINWSWWLVFTPELVAAAFYLLVLIGSVGAVRSGVKRRRWLYVGSIRHHHD